MSKLLLGLLGLSFCISTGWASNKQREMEYAKNIKASLSIGKIVWLQVKDKQFLSLYTETEQKKTLGAAIILHSIGGHPNQQPLTRPLRTFLPQHKWTTLALQMPVQEMGAKQQDYYSLFDDAKARIQTGVDFLIDAGIDNIVIIGYGMGGMMAVHFLSETADESVVSAIATISLSVPNSKNKRVQVLDFIANIEQPFLDVSAEFDLPEVIENERKKRISAKGNPDYRQFVIKGEGHAYANNERLVVKRVYSWMNRVLK
jgi:pimeloyl-ACP methyl ester carboxylesterase